jgi:hypothetical protein
MIYLLLKSIVALEICKNNPGLGESCTAVIEDGIECAPRCQPDLLCNSVTCIDTLGECGSKARFSDRCGVVREGHHGATCLKKCELEYQCIGLGNFHWNDTATCQHQICQAKAIQGESCGFAVVDQVTCKRVCHDNLICNGGYCTESIPYCNLGPSPLNALCGLVTNGPHGALCKRACESNRFCVGNLTNVNEARCLEKIPSGTTFNPSKPISSGFRVIPSLWFLIHLF